MVNNSTQSLVITGLVFVCLILNIVGVLTPLLTIEYLGGKVSAFIYYHKHNNTKHTKYCNKIDDQKQKDYCITSKTLAAALLSFSSLLFLLTFLMLFISYNNPIKSLSIILNILIFLINGGLIAVLILMIYPVIKAINNNVGFTLGPSVICFGVSSILSIISLVLFTTLKVKAKKL